MAAAQRYVSDELTHFVGRGLRAPEQYDLLVRILRTGRLAPHPHDPDLAGDLAVDLDAAPSSNRAYDPLAVCLCDIPVGDLEIHIRKYSPFGLSFRKAFAVAAGASPLFYVAAASRSAGANGDAGASRAQRYDATLREYERLRRETDAVLADAPPRERALLARWASFAHFLDFEVLAFLKFFEYPDPDEGPENHYMEREWRLLDELRFSLDDVRRVIVPEPYAARLRDDVPEFRGQVTFADGVA